MSNYSQAEGMAGEYPRVAQVFAILALVDAVNNLRLQQEGKAPRFTAPSMMMPPQNREK